MSLAVAGIQNLLFSHSVDLAIETHANNLEQHLDNLQKIGHSMIDLQSGNITTKEEYTDRHSLQIGHILLSKKLRSESFAKEIMARIRKEIKTTDELISSVFKVKYKKWY